MRLWRISSVRHARDFNGGYGLLQAGRWNTPVRPVTYCSTVPSLAALEKRVHVSDPALLPPLMLVEYEAPGDLPARRIEIGDLPRDWTRREVDSQRTGDEWLDTASEALLFVPSVVMPIAAAPERNVVVNHRHPAAARIAIASVTPFSFDVRLFDA